MRLGPAGRWQSWETALQFSSPYSEHMSMFWVSPGTHPSWASRQSISFSQSARREQDNHDEDQSKFPLRIRRDPLSSQAVITGSWVLLWELGSYISHVRFFSFSKYCILYHDIWLPLLQTHHRYLHYNTWYLSSKIPWHSRIFFSYSLSHAVYTNMLKSVNSRTKLLELQFLILHLPAMWHQASYLTSLQFSFHICTMVNTNTFLTVLLWRLSELIHVKLSE